MRLLRSGKEYVYAGGDAVTGAYCNPNIDYGKTAAAAIDEKLKANKWLCPVRKKPI